MGAYITYYKNEVFTCACVHVAISRMSTGSTRMYCGLNTLEIHTMAACVWELCFEHAQWWV